MPHGLPRRRALRKQTGPCAREREECRMDSLSAPQRPTKRRVCSMVCEIWGERVKIQVDSREKFDCAFCEI